MPVIGYGTFPQKETLCDNIPIAYNLGYRMIDTSDNYLNEQFVGDGLSRIKSNDIVVVTKFSQPLRTYEFETCFTESLNKVNKRGLIYLLHWPFPYLWRRQWRKMEDLYLKGECAAIGVCNFDVGYLKELLMFCRVKPMINQFERHPLFQQKELVTLCQNENIQVMSYSPLARMDAELSLNSTLIEIASKYSKTVNQIILRWNIDTHCIPIPASSSEIHIRENINIFDFELTEEEINEINGLDCGKRIRFNPRTRFEGLEKLSFAIVGIKYECPITAKVLTVFYKIGNKIKKWSNGLLMK